MTSGRIAAVPRYRNRCVVVQPDRAVPDLAEDARNGLLVPPRSLPPKYFYDERGSQLFDRICATGEYYLTRAEDELLRRHSEEIIRTALPVQILELGSGLSRKTRRLFDACRSLAHACEYTPFDVCEEVLWQAARELLAEYPWLGVTPLVGDYHAGLRHLPVGDGCTLFMFLGSTIGNFTPPEARTLVGEVRSRMRAGDFFLLGADRVKDVDVIEAAYNDQAGVTSQFNLNLLRVLNRELNADFDVSGFEHRARYNGSLSRVEMYLVSRRDQSVHLDRLDRRIRLQRGERILTELSYKFERQDIEELLRSAGLRIVRHYDGCEPKFSLVLATPI